MNKYNQEAVQGEGLDVFLNRIGSAIRTNLPGSYWVRAEILKADLSKNNHYSLELVAYEGAQEAKARAWIWSSNTHIVRQFEQTTGAKLKAGLKILFECSVQFRPDFGLSLTINQIDSRFTLGDMEAKLQAIRNRLVSLGEIDRNKQIPTPGDFTRVAVISPESAAGLGDFKTVAERLERFNLCTFDYFSALFQGPNAIESLVSAITEAVKSHTNGQIYDALVIVRGGGDKAGLYQLNEIRIARCVCRSPIPVFVGIGHERDNTILDELANTRCATPSIVASTIQEKIIANSRNAQINFGSLLRLSQSILSNSKHEINDYLASTHANSQRGLMNWKDLLSEHKATLRHLPRSLAQNARHDIENLERQILHVSKSQISYAFSEIDRLSDSIESHSKLAINQSIHLIEDRYKALYVSAKISLASQKSSIASDYSSSIGKAKLLSNTSKSEVNRLGREVLNSSKSTLKEQKHTINEIDSFISVKSKQLLSTAEHELKIFIERILNLDPQKILNRGFALVKDSNNNILTSAKKISSGQNISIELKDGTVKANTKR